MTMDIADLKILVVDDHLSARKMIERILQGIGAKNIDQAADAQEATDKLDAVPYDVIFLDWHLPGSSGYYFLQTCREERKYDKMAFVIISAESGPHFITEAMKAGATSYIVKPFTEEILRDHLNRTLVWLKQHYAVSEKQRQS
jgi:PleD family two-component response regulator